MFSIQIPTQNYINQQTLKISKIKITAYLYYQKQSQNIKKSLFILIDLQKIYKHMKSNGLISVILISIILLFISHSQQQTAQQSKPDPVVPAQQTKQQQKLPDHTVIELDKPYPQQLNKDQQYSAKYRITVPQAKVTELKQDKWFLFVEVETAQQFVWEKTKIQLFIINKNDNQKPIKQCDTTNGVDSCFLTNSQFNYQTQKVQARVTCQQFCKFTISSQISSKYKLTPNQALQLNFQNTAYSKLFTLDTYSYQNFKRLQIILKPTSFLSYSAPIRLYINRGETIPTKQKHHYSGIHLWDDGVGVFINYPDAANLFTILVQGPQKNVLTLKSNIVYENKPISTVNYQPYFGYVESQEKKMFYIAVDKKKKTIVKLTTLTGSVQMFSIKDQDMKDIDIEFTPLSRSYGELEYKFEPEFFQKNKNFKIKDKLIVQIMGNKDSTFVFESYSSDSKMNYITAQVNRYSDLPSKQTDLYYLSLFQPQQQISTKNKQSRIQIMTTTYQQVNLGTKILLCKAQKIQQCEPTKQEIEKLNNNQSIDNDKRKIMKNVLQDKSVPGVVYFDTVIPYSQFYKKNNTYHIYVIIAIENPKQQQILYTLQYINLGQTYFLKQKQLKRDRLSIDQIKYYTFVNNDKDVKSIKIHSNEISGEVQIVGYREDPRNNNVEGKQIYQYHSMVTFLDVKQGEQVYLMVQGVENAYYSLYLQLIRQSQNSTDQKGTSGYNEIVVQQNVKYDFYIKPNEKIIVQMRITNPSFQLFIGSHLPLDLCLTQILDSPPFKPNCQIMQTLTKNQRIGLKMDKGLVGNMGITNNNDKTVELKLQIKGKTIQSKCTNAALNVMNVWSLKASNEINKSVTCYKFNINRRQNLEIIAEFNNMEIENATVSWQLNDKQKQLMISQRHLIWKKQILKVCGSSDQQRCQLTLYLQTAYATDIEVVVQFLDKDVILVDGMAQPSFSPQKNTQPKHFRYQMLNLVPTTIVLENKAGYYHFFGKIVSRKDLYAASPRASIFPTQKEHLFKSQNPFYFLYQVYQLNQKTIKLSNCTVQCVLLLTVTLTGDDQNPQQPGRFTIQVSQQDRFLKQNQPSMGYLQRQSLAFYQYYNPSNGSIYIQLSNQNSKCAKIYIKKGNQTRATPSAYDKMADNQNFLIYQNAEPGTYSISLQAKGKHMMGGCTYTIQVLSSTLKLARIKRGIFNDKIFQTNQSAHFVYQHRKNQSFKITSLTKTGEVMIKIKVLKQGQLNKLLSVNNDDLKKYIEENIKYEDSNIDYIKIHHKKSPYFCYNCTYLISIIGTKYTQTSIVIPSRDVQIPIIQDSTIKDQVKETEVTKYRVFTSNLAQFKLYVQYGKINVTITESIENKTLVSKVYQQTKEPIYEKFNSTISKIDDKGLGYEFLHYDIITIVGLANSSFYSFELLSSGDQQKGGGNVKYGIPQYFFLQPKQNKCFKGILDDDSQEFILSFDDSNKRQIENLTITTKVNDKKVQYKTQYGINEMTLELVDLKIMKPSPYQICLLSSQFLSMTFIQSAHIMMLPTETSILLTHNTNLTLGAKGTTLIEIDQCSSRSVISISSSFNDLHTVQTQISQIRRGNNLIQFYHWGPVFVHLQTNGSRIKWRNKEAYLETGLGYDRFVSGNAIAYKQGDNIKVQAKPIQQIMSYTKDKNMQITQIAYKIVLGRNQNQLRKSLNCFEQDVIKYQYKTVNINQSTTASFKIDQSLRQKFSKQRFFFAGVIVNLNIEVNKTIQNYRFVYPMVDIQREVLMGGDYIQVDQSKGDKNGDNSSSGQRNSIIMIVIGVVIFGIAIWLVYKKWVKKCLKKRRQGLADQGSGFKYTQFASMDG